MILQGDCLETMKTLADNSVDSIVSDPPYGLSFMGNKWDYSVPSVEIWREALRVLKPGGHLLAFGGTRTYHRLVVNIEDAGFEIRDQVMWIYASGFPKSMSIDKAIDKQAGAKVEKGDSFNVVGGTTASNGGSKFRSDHPDYQAYEPSTDLAKQWQGWGTALKPANEPICVARKPISEKTVAANVIKWGCGALNIDESRIEAAGPDVNARKSKGANHIAEGVTFAHRGAGAWNSTQGRWPANIIFDEDAARELDLQSGKCRSAGNYPSDSIGTGNGTTYLAQKPQGKLYSDNGGASRFFYIAKASKRERNAGLEGMPTSLGGSLSGGNDKRKGDKPQLSERQNHHPTVKPIKLMEYLIKLVTPQMTFACPCCSVFSNDSATKTSTTAQMRDMQQRVQAEGQSPCGEVLLEGLRLHSDANNSRETMRTVSEDISACTNGQESAAVLLKKLREQGGGTESKNGKGNHNSEGLSGALSTRASDGNERGNDNGASLIDGKSSGQASKENRSGSSSKRNQDRQSNRKSRSSNETPARQASQAKGETDSVPALHGNDQGFRSCGKCGEALVLTPSTILDPFAGSGSTGVACKNLGFNFIGCELNPEYAEIAEKRIAHAEASA